MPGSMSSIISKIKKSIPTGLTARLVKFFVISDLILGILLVGIFYTHTYILREMVKDDSETLTKRTENDSRETLAELTLRSLKDISYTAADNTDDELWVNGYELTILSSMVEDVIKNPDNYGRIPINPPDKNNAGKLALQLLAPNGYENISSESIDTLERLANLAPIMASYLGEYTIDIYISLPDGTTLAMDRRSDEKYDNDGSIRSYDATARFWYREAVRSGKLYFSPAVHSYFSDNNNIVTYSLPVYVDGGLVAVLEGSLDIQSLQERVEKTLLGGTGFNVLITKAGQIVGTSRQNGELAMRDDLEEDVRESVNSSLKEVIDLGLSGESGAQMVQVDGENYYAGYAPLVTMGWTQLFFVSVDEIMAPTKALVEEIEQSRDGMIDNIDKEFQSNVVIMLVVIIVLIQASILIASRITKNMVSPIDAEMEMSTQIQESMLPKLTSDFTDREEFALYAKAVPAKKVGGDFYDFFYIDDDHLAIVIADVSGKGITAALFMALSKQMIQSQMIIHGTDVAGALSVANLRLLEESVKDMFVTVWAGILTLSTGQLTFVDAGHKYPAIKKRGESFVIEKDNHSVIVAGIKKAKYKMNEIILAPGDILYLYTDGVTEARSAQGGMFSEGRLCDTLNDAPDATPEEIDSFVRRRLKEFTRRAEQYDDITTLCLKYKKG